MSAINPIIAQALIGTIDGTAAAPQISFGGGGGYGSGNTGTGIYGSSTVVGLSIAGSSILSVSAAGLSVALAALTTLTVTNLTATNASVGGIVIMSGAGAPVDGTTGDNVANTGSLYSDTTNGKLYINTGLITNPTWVVVGGQS